MILTRIQKKAVPKSFIIFLVLISFKTQAQNSLNELVTSERNFANYAVTHSTQEAFVNFMADDAIVFRKGQAVNALELWKSRTPDSTQLSWYPSYAAVASSGDLGCTAGPWEYRSKRSDKDATAFGHFATIWKKHADGNWKVALDLGISNEKPGIPEAGASIENTTKTIVKKPRIDFMAVEKNFIKSENKTGASVFASYLSQAVIVYRPGEQPDSSQITIKNTATNKNIKYTFTLLNGGISNTNDFGYAFGTVAFFSDNKINNGNYLRVWRNENGRWRIILDVIAK